MKDSGVLSELQCLKEQLEKSEEERMAIETQLSAANSTVTQLQDEGTALQRQIQNNSRKMVCITDSTSKLTDSVVHDKTSK